MEQIGKTQAKDPYLGKALRGECKGLNRWRTGQFREIYENSERCAPYPGITNGATQRCVSIIPVRVSFILKKKRDSSPIRQFQWRNSIKTITNDPNRRGHAPGRKSKHRNRIETHRLENRRHKRRNRAPRPQTHQSPLASKGVFEKAG